MVKRKISARALKMTGDKHTLERYRRCLEMHETGHDWPAIAAHMGLSVRTVKTYASRARTYPSAQMLAEIHRLRMLGYSVHDLKNATGIKTKNLWIILCQEGWL